MVNITENAAKQIVEIMKESGGDNSFLRTFVQGGGCSGFQYGFLIEEDQNEDDFLIEEFGIKILVDSMSMTYLTGATIDYKDDLMGSQFVIDNPNAQTTCGCGSSFSV